MLAGESATFAPSLESSVDGCRLRLKTVRFVPALSRFKAIGFPINPKPMKPILQLFKVSIAANVEVSANFTQIRLGQLPNDTVFTAEFVSIIKNFQFAC